MTKQQKKEVISLCNACGTVCYFLFGTLDSDQWPIDAARWYLHTMKKPIYRA